jgi:hypothetical protein
MCCCRVKLSVKVVCCCGVPAEADANKVALLAFPGVVSRPPKPSARAATPSQAGQADGVAAGGEGAADAAAAE